MFYMTGADKFILFGSAGALDKEKTKGKYVIPTEAYRDEGMSYHYAPPGDGLQEANHDLGKFYVALKLAEAIEELEGHAS